MTETTETPYLERVRKLLAKAQAEGTTQPEAEALTAKAAELMARHGIDKALLAATRPETDKPGDKVIDVDNPWARVHAHLLCGIGSAMRCQAVMLPRADSGTRIHLFGFQSDLERVDLMYTSLMLQMANGLRQADVPRHAQGGRLRAWNRSYLLGFATAAVARVREAEARAVNDGLAADCAAGSNGTSSRTAVVLADRSLVIKHSVAAAYPLTRKTRLTYSGSGYSTGYAKGQQANLRGTSVNGQGARALHG
jgi:hypothetical protein